MALYAFNGTWNEDDPAQKGETGHDTNVVKFCEAYQGTPLYQDGVGTRWGLLGRMFGGVAGFGGRRRVKLALARLECNLAAGDKDVDVVGFSRGSALAVDFTNAVAARFPQLEIRFLGLFDMVASFGIPGNEINLGWRLTPAENVKRCAHAMALDERRHAFPLTRLRRPGAGRDRFREVWFRGVHSDVGGGQNLGLTSIAMTWMLQQALDAGVPAEPAHLAGYRALWNPDAPITHNLDLHVGPLRRVEAEDEVHESVKPRKAERLGHGLLEYNNPLQLGLRATGTTAGQN